MRQRASQVVRRSTAARKTGVQKHDTIIFRLVLVIRREGRVCEEVKCVSSDTIGVISGAYIRADPGQSLS